MNFEVELNQFQLNGPDLRMMKNVFFLTKKKSKMNYTQLLFERWSHLNDGKLYNQNQYGIVMRSLPNKTE